MDKKLKNMLEEFLTDSDRLLDDYTDDENGNLIICSESFAKLTGILKEGLAIYNKIVEENLYADNFMVQNSLQVISEAASKIEISEENAKKLNTKNAISRWEDLHADLLTLGILLLADEVGEDVSEQ
jgi:hypothetical protein